MRVDLQPSFVLHSRPYRDSSAIVDLFTAEQGRLSVVAKGARRVSRRGSRNSMLQAFVPLLASFSGRAELKTLRSCEVAGRAHQLVGERLYSGLYLNELLVRLLHQHDPHPALFALYAATLDDLAGEGAIDICLRRFEIKLLDELGYSFDLSVDSDRGDEIREESLYMYQPESGLVRCEGRPANGRPAYAGQDIKRIAAGDLADEAGQTAKRLLREVLSGHLGGEPLRSRQLFRAARMKAGQSGVEQG